MMNTSLPSPDWLTPILEKESLPAEFAQVVVEHFMPIAAQIAEWHEGEPLVIGVNGGQGTGKSTLSMILKAALAAEFGMSAAVLSIDDIYLTKKQRQDLAEEVHPLLVTRGVPGTHDVNLGIEVINALKNAQLPVAVPCFDKAADDRRPEDQWQVVTEPVDVIIFEGWCIDTLPQESEELAVAINDLEKEEDPDGVWRQYVNHALSGSYRDLFSMIDKLIMLKAPSMECILNWRTQQEDKLRARMTSDDDQSGIMDDAQIKRFIMHYERLTRWMLSEMPDRADIVIKLNEDHGVASS